MPNKLKLNKKNTYYFIGIGGSGMSAQAKILISSGYKVAGSELVHSPNTDELETLGVHINYEITQNNIQDNQVIIYSNAVSIDQIELQKAKELDLAIYNRAEFISLLETAKGFSIAISGAHGKTSTTSLVAFLLEEAGLDPTCLIGGILPKWGSNARVGKSEYFVYEACEAFGNLANYNPTHIIVTNIDKDHLEYFDNDYNKFKEYWIEYINRIASNESNFVLLNYDDLEIKSVISRLSLNVHFFSLEKTNHDEERIIAHATNIQTTENGTGFFLEFFLLKKAISVSLPLFGKHNVANATAALTMCSQFVEPEKLIPTLQRFQNSKRRFELAGIFNGAKIYNDYGHLPVEVACAISAGEQSIATIDEGKVIAVFQPHLSTRTKEHCHDFAKALLTADIALIAPIYRPAGREESEIEISSENIIEEMRKIMETQGDVIQYKCQQYKTIAEHDLKNELQNLAHENDVILLIGAGSIGDWAKKLLDCNIKN